MRNRTRLFGWIVCTALSLGSAERALACAFHGYTPDPTLVDLLLATEQVVIARLSSTNPRRFQSVETLAGPDVIDLPLRPAAATQARLTADPGALALLARDGAYGPWQEVAILDDSFRAIIYRVMQRQSDWQFGGDAERLAFFTGLINAPNPDLRRLALRELDRAPYASLQRQPLPRIPDLRASLTSGEDALRPIRVLLAGLSNDRSYSTFLARELAEAVERDTPYLGAYATALIELEGQEAVNLIITEHLKPATTGSEAREKLLQALALQYRAAPGPTRRKIAREVANLSRTNPDIGAAAARQFGSSNRWSALPPSAPSQGTRPATSVGPDR